MCPVRSVTDVPGMYLSQRITSHSRGAALRPLAAAGRADGQHGKRRRTRHSSSGRRLTAARFLRGTSGMLFRYAQWSPACGAMAA
jgi:hypothetical protein